MREFLELYPYKPQYDLGSIVVDLYVEVGAISMALIQEKIKRTKETF